MPIACKLTVACWTRLPKKDLSDSYRTVEGAVSSVVDAVSVVVGVVVVAAAAAAAAAAAVVVAAVPVADE